MSYVLDTLIISAFAPAKPLVPDVLARWIEKQNDTLFVASITIAEIEQGICKLRRLGGVERAARLQDWLDQLTSTFSDRIIDLDVESAREAGAFADAAIASGQTPGLADIIIAATTAVRGHALLTRNLRHFKPLSQLRRGFTCLDPFIDLPHLAD